MNLNKSQIRLYCRQDLKMNAEINLDFSKRHYLINVMRKKIEDQILIFNEFSGEWLAEIKDINKSFCSLKCLKKTKEIEIVSDLWLLFSPVKNSRLDFLVQKATELGVSKILPVKTDNCQYSKLNIKKLKLNIVEATEQTGRISMPEITEFENLNNVLESWDEKRVIIFCDESLSEKGNNYKFFNFDKFKKKSAAILIGPEGGFSNSEKKLILSKKNVLSVSLGPRILRSDTAVVSSITLYQSLYGDWYDD